MSGVQAALAAANGAPLDRSWFEALADSDEKANLHYELHLSHVERNNRIANRGT